MNSFGVCTQHARRNGAHEKTFERRGDRGGWIVSVDRPAASGEACPLDPGCRTTRSSFQKTQEAQEITQEQTPPGPPRQTLQTLIVGPRAASATLGRSPLALWSAHGRRYGECGPKRSKGGCDAGVSKGCLLSGCKL